MVEKHSDRFAFQQDGHFFCRKEGETLNQNWIVENLNNAFSTWNGKLTELWGRRGMGRDAKPAQCDDRQNSSLHRHSFNPSNLFERRLRLR